MDAGVLTGEFAEYLATCTRAALEYGIWGWFDDDLAFVRPWGFDPIEVTAPTLIVHGDEDRMVPIGHGRWLAHRIPTAEGWWRPGDGHISVLSTAPEALRWLAPHVPRR